MHYKATLFVTRDSSNSTRYKLCAQKDLQGRKPEQNEKAFLALAQISANQGDHFRISFNKR